MGNSIDFPTELYEWDLSQLSDGYLSPNNVLEQIIRFDNSTAPQSIIDLTKKVLRNPDCTDNMDYFTYLGNTQKNLGIGSPSSFMFDYDDGFEKSHYLLLADGNILLVIQCYDYLNTDELGSPVGWNQIFKDALSKIYH